MTVTIKDVAKAAEVSISTVSRVINDSKPVSPEARRKVLKAIEDLGYQPNEVARSLVTKKSSLIGVIAGDVGNDYSAKVLRGIEEIGRMYGYDILLSCSYGSADQELRSVSLLKQKQVEGMIILSDIYNEKLNDLLNEIKTPYVYLNSSYIVSHMASVLIDSKYAIYKLVDFLVSKGHRSILYLSAYYDDDKHLDNLKVKAFKDAVGTLNIKGYVFKDKRLLNKDLHNVDLGIENTIKSKRVTAIVCPSDIIAIEMMNYFYDRGIKVPDDISITGFGDDKISELYRPQLTTVQIPKYDIGAVSVRRILKELDEKPYEKDLLILPSSIIDRTSVKHIK